MFKVSDKYKKEIDKLGGRSFVSKVIIRDKEYNDDNIKDMNLSESVNPSDNFSLGSVVSNTFEINLIDIDTSVIFEDAIIKPYIGLELENKIEYIPLGVFTVDNVTIKDKKVKLECMDNMIKLERAYFSEFKYPCNINEVLKEICKKANIKCNSILPNYSIDEIKGYSFRQAIGILATLSGCFARFNRVGELEILSYADVGLRITPDTFLKFEKNDKDYIIGKITAKKGDKTFSKGSNTEIIIDNPVITEEITNDIYNKFKDFTYRPYTLSWQGNPAVQAGDRVTIIDLDGKEYNTLIMEQKFTYNGGIKSELKASGKTESSDRFDSKGPVTQAMENYSIEQAAIKVALIKKADIDSLNAIDAKINNLYAQDLTVLNAKIRDLQSNKISTVEFNALESKLQLALIGKADVNELNVAVERVGILEGKTLSVENQLAGNLTAKNFKANSIAAGSGIIAEGAIGSAQISDLELNKLRAGDISTSKFRITSANGAIQIVGNQILINRDNVNRVILGEYIKQDNTTDYGLLIRAKDGKTVMFDSEGVHNAGITNGAIDNNKVADNANISGNKLDINSVIREVNNKGTETIKGTKVTVGGRTLDVELSTQNNTITEHSKELLTQKASIQALDNSIKLKVDNQTFKETSNYINESINNTKAQITTTNNNLSKAISEINILKGEIGSKVGQTDIDKSISNIKFGDRNLSINSDFRFGWRDWGFNNPGNNADIEVIDDDTFGKCAKVTMRNNYQGIYQGMKRVRGNIYSWSVWIKANKPGVITISHEQGEGSKNINLTTEWTRYTGTGIWNGPGGCLCFYSLNGTDELIAYISRLKYVEGNTIPFSWTPAPEDINTAIINSAKKTYEKISTVETELQQTKESFGVSVKDLNNKTSTIEANITNINTNLSNKINDSKIEAINNSNNYTNTQITVVNTRISNAESSLSVLKSQISTKVSQTDIDKSISNIKLGGRNLALETKPQSYSGFTGRINDCQMGYSILLDTLEVGDSVTVSYVFSYKDLIPVEGRNDFGIWLQGCGNVTEWGRGGFNGGDRLTSRINFGVGKKGEFRVEYTFKITSDMKKNKSWFSNFRMDFIKSGEVGVKFFKVEKSTKASDYTPAPEDTDKKIQDNIQIITERITNVESSFTQKANSINAVVNSVQSILNTKADGSTVSNMQSQLASLNIGLDGIKTEVAKKTDKGSIISAINQSAEEIKIDASKIQLNGITTFSDDTGIKAVEIDNNAVNLFNWAKNGRYIGALISLIQNNDSSKPLIAICNAVDSYASICYKHKDKSGYGTYVEFDKYNVAKTRAIAPIKIYENVEMYGNTMYNVNFEADNIVQFHIGRKFIGYFNKDRLSVLGNLDVTGRKNRVVENTVYGDLMLNAVESTECWFTDMLIEQSRTDVNGDCIIWFDNKFLQTVNTRYRYKVDVTPLGEFASNGKLTYVRVVEKTEKYFKVRGTPNTLFDWTVTAKQKGYESERLEKKAS
ncbi:kID repeat family protein [Clostridium baratii str. Sullivan]|uniref:KID repeat family protein n=1 Tax=Clostridium baratii str. Sullivan TaxID=1415775 RepID=A0A0A7FW02_9CLOT|nr:hypothetical protein [Clostridium baratii]AIY83125.1 kID repeat family protein [Clostridium baratii str. Sullivan]